MRNDIYDDQKTVEDVLEYLYRQEMPKYAQVVLDRERLLNEAWGKLSMAQLEKTIDVIQHETDRRDCNCC